MKVQLVKEWSVNFQAYRLYVKSNDFCVDSFSLNELDKAEQLFYEVIANERDKKTPEIIREEEI